MSRAGPLTWNILVSLKSPRPVALAVGLSVLLCHSLRLPNLDASLQIDEAGSLAQASAADYWTTARQDVHPPLYYLMLRVSLDWTTSVPLLRMFPVLCGTGLAALAAWSMRPSLPAALAAGTMGALLPQLVHHSQQLRPYALLYLLLGLALTLAARQIARPAVETFSPPFLALALVLLAAAATHLTTGFFLLALAPLLAWTARGRSAGAWVVSFWPLLPAGLLLVWFKLYFITQPADLAEGWWMPATNAPAVLAALAEATGWDNVRWLADAAGCQWWVAGWGVPITALAACLTAFGTAWSGPNAGPLNILLPVSALIYGSTLIGYALCFEPIVMGRTLLPALLPLGAVLARIGWPPSGPLRPHPADAAPIAHLARRLERPGRGRKDLAGLSRRLLLPTPWRGLCRRAG